MIIDALLNMIIDLGNIMTFFNVPTITELPFGMDEILVNAVGQFKTVMFIFPPLEVVFNAILIYLGFKLALKLSKMIPFIGRALD